MLHTREVAGSKPAAPITLKALQMRGLRRCWGRRPSHHPANPCPQRAHCRCRRHRAARGRDRRRRAPGSVRGVDHLDARAHPPRESEDAHADREAPRRERVAHVVDSPVLQAGRPERQEPLARAPVVDVDPPDSRPGRGCPDAAATSPQPPPPSPAAARDASTAPSSRTFSAGPGRTRGAPCACPHRGRRRSSRHRMPPPAAHRDRRRRSPADRTDPAPSRAPRPHPRSRPRPPVTHGRCRCIAPRRSGVRVPLTPPAAQWSHHHER
jgi:hypothetical protein